LEEEEKKRLTQPSSMMEEEEESDPEQCPFHAEYLCRTYWLAGLLEVRPYSDTTFITSVRGEKARRSGSRAGGLYPFLCKELVSVSSGRKGSDGVVCACVHVCSRGVGGCARRPSVWRSAIAG
jgi:hypothetical protein